jgi:REP element-mobilizing transposase RayT
MELPKRKRPESGVWETENGPTIVFDTVCTQGRKIWLANDPVHRLLREIWLAADAWRVGRYVLMPDHVHYFASPGATSIPFENWLRYWKSQFTKQFKHVFKKTPPSGWQANDWSTRMRNAEAYEEKWEYIRMNPVRRGLATTPEEWPYCGELEIIRWE